MFAAKGHSAIIRSGSQGDTQGEKGKCKAKSVFHQLAYLHISKINKNSRLCISCYSKVWLQNWKVLCLNNMCPRWISMYEDDDGSSYSYMHRMIMEIALIVPTHIQPCLSVAKRRVQLQLRTRDQAILTKSIYVGFLEF